MDRDLDEVVTENDRDSVGGSYAIWVRDRVEADEELKNLTANQLGERKVATGTLLECLLLELVFYKENGKHLDMAANVTLCAGSRNAGGHVPSVEWDSVYGKLVVGCYSVADSYDKLRARQVVF